MASSQVNFTGFLHTVEGKVFQTDRYRSEIRARTVGSGTPGSVFSEQQTGRQVDRQRFQPDRVEVGPRETVDDQFHHRSRRFLPGPQLSDRSPVRRSLRPGHIGGSEAYLTCSSRRFGENRLPRGGGKLIGCR